MLMPSSVPEYKVETLYSGTGTVPEFWREHLKKVCVHISAHQGIKYRSRTPYLGTKCEHSPRLLSVHPQLPDPCVKHVSLSGSSENYGWQGREKKTKTSLLLSLLTGLLVGYKFTGDKKFTPYTLLGSPLTVYCW